MGNTNSKENELYEKWSEANKAYKSKKTIQNGVKLVKIDKEYVDYVNNQFKKQWQMNSKTAWGRFLNSFHSGPTVWKYMYIDGNPDISR